MSRWALWLVAGLMSGCANSPTGQRVADPTITIPNMDIEQAKEFYTERCSKNTGRIFDASDYSIGCAMSNSRLAAPDVLLQMFSQPMSTTQPEVLVQYSWANAHPGSRISVRAWIETQNAFGRTDRQYLNSDRHRRELQEELDADGRVWMARAPASVQRFNGLQAPKGGRPAVSNQTITSPSSAIEHEKLPASDGESERTFLTAQRISMQYGCSESVEVLSSKPNRQVYQASCGRAGYITVICEAGDCQAGR